jgi:hypothetical protein
MSNTTIRAKAQVIALGFGLGLRLGLGLGLELGLRLGLVVYLTKIGHLFDILIKWEKKSCKDKKKIP